MSQRPWAAITPFSANEVARRSAIGDVQLRHDSFRLRIVFDELRAADGDDLPCIFECSAQISSGRSDEAMFRELFSADGRDAVTTSDVSLYIARHANTHVNALVSNQTADAWLTADGREELCKLLAERVDASAFACGLSTLAPFTLSVRSDAVERRQIESDDRARAEARNAEQTERLRHAGDLLKEFQRLRAEAGDETAGQLLHQIAPADRGAVLNATLLAGTSAKKMIWAVAGNALVRIDINGEQPATKIVELPPTLGPLRSVQSAMLDEKVVLLIGAQNGIWCASPHAPADAKAFVGPTSASGFGFNAALIDGEMLLATHAEHGVVAWSTTGETTSSIIAAKAGARLPIKLSGNRLAFVAKDGAASFVHLIDIKGQSTTTGEALPLGSRDVVAMTSDLRRVFVMLDDGTIHLFDRRSFRKVETIARPATRVVAAGALPWLGSVRILTSREDAAIDCFGPDDQLITQYVSVHRGSKIVAASGDTVAAVSTDRQRLIVWRAWDGRAPFAELHLATLTRHRIADIDFA